jgi:hypothetical protein
MLNTHCLEDEGSSKRSKKQQQKKQEQPQKTKTNKHDMSVTLYENTNVYYLCIMYK